MEGWEIAAFNSQSQIIGAGRFNGAGNCGMAIWGDDELTEQVDGALLNEEISFRLWDLIEEKPIEIEVIEGSTKWQADSYVVGQIHFDGSTPVAFGIHQSYPNPTNGPVRLVFGLENSNFVSLKVYDLHGRHVVTLMENNIKAGYHQISWNTDLVPSGLYAIRLESAGENNMIKVAVVK